ncbi:bifunctional folylpolyglutamate synthase/dihydrofolate synthase, partial [Helicobacter pylori]|nr:bifunctional folylpolyglutamate synthase/dihydrofolate synthase [Helicobacter pylori]
LKGILETLGLEHALFEDLEENENYLVYGSFLVANAFYKRYQKKRD